MPRRSTPTPRSRGARAAAPGRLGVLFASPLGRGLRRAGLAAVSVLALSLVVSQARAAVRRMPAYRIAPEDVSFVDLDPAVDEPMRDGLVARLPSVWPADLPGTYAAGVEGNLRQVLGAHPMVREVLDLEVRFPREVRARVVVRTPLALLYGRVVSDEGVAEGYVAVDGDGVVLDAAVYAGFLAAHDVVRVDGVRARCPPVGRRWIDADEQPEEALAIARVANRLNAERDSIRSPRVVRADVSGFPARPKDRGRGEVVLLLEDGRRVSWGRSERASSAVSREDGYEAKRDRLADLLAAGVAGDLDVRFSVPGVPARRR